MNVSPNFLRNGLVGYVTVIAGYLWGRVMNHHHSPRAIRRAQWFVELTSALTEAEKLLMLMEADGGHPDEAARLRQRVEAVRADLGILNRVVLAESRIVSSEWPATEAGGC